MNTATGGSCKKLMGAESPELGAHTGSTWGAIPFPLGFSGRTYGLSSVPNKATEAALWYHPDLGNSCDGWK